MTNINCSFDCMYQQDGKCCMDSMTASMNGTGNGECAYYAPCNGNMNNSGTIISVKTNPHV